MFAIILNRYDGEMMERMKMDRRRLEHAHFCYAMLNVAGWYKGFAVKNVLFTSDQATYLCIYMLYNIYKAKIYLNRFFWTT